MHWSAGPDRPWRIGVTDPHRRDTIVRTAAAAMGTERATAWLTGRGMPATLITADGTVIDIDAGAAG